MMNYQNYLFRLTGTTYFGRVIQMAVVSALPHAAFGRKKAIGKMHPTLYLTYLNLRPEEAAYLEYQRKLELYKSAKARSNELDSTLRLHFDSQRELEFDAKLIREQKRLLDMQPKIIGELRIF